MRHTLPILAALAAVVGPFAQSAAAQPLPPEVPYRDPRPRFRLPPHGPVVRAAPPVVSYTVQGYQPRATNQPIYNEPPQPLR